MSQEIVKKDDKNIELSLIEQVVMQGDLSALNPEQRVIYYNKVCESAGLNPFTRPFDYIKLNGRLTLYAKKDCTEQLRKLNGISIEGLEDRMMGDVFIIKAKARTRDGRTDEATGAVTIGNLKGDALANAIMKAETKAKRRVTLSISGMGWTDETEIETIPNAKQVVVDLNTGEIQKEPIQIKVEQQKPVAKISAPQAQMLTSILSQCDDKYKDWVYSYLKNEFKTENFCDLPAELYQRMKDAAVKNMDANLEKQRANQESNLLTAEV
jgi:hypothetical protein